MEDWSAEINGSSIAPPVENQEIVQDDVEWLQENQLPIIVPIKDVGVEFVRNAILGIPKECPVIFVSATEKPDVRAQERSLAHQYHGREERDILWIPQIESDDGGGTDSAVKQYLDTAYPALVEDGGVASGYREALLIGSFVAKSLDADYLGVVDGDNWNPMAIREFVLLYARGLRNKNSYVSLEWRCKPKCGDDGFEWRDAGRTSSVINEYMNRLLMLHTDYTSFDVITSSCSGDHAMTMELWDAIEHTENHSGEVNAFVKVMEGDPVGDIVQYRTMSPMFHQYGGSEHIEQERSEGFAPIYHSDLCDDQLKEKITQQTGGGVRELETYPKTRGVGGDFLAWLDEVKS